MNAKYTSLVNAVGVLCHGQREPVTTDPERVRLFLYQDSIIRLALVIQKNGNGYLLLSVDEMKA